MIELTRLNGHPLLVNPDLIKLAEASPDTMLTLVTGEKVVVRESTAELATRVRAYRVSVLAECGLAAVEAPATALASMAARQAHAHPHGNGHAATHADNSKTLL